MTANDNPLQHCLDLVYRYLGYRPRSEAEVRHYLRRRGFSGEIIAKAMAELKGQNLVDDLAFAEFWKNNRLSFKPRSSRLIRKELRDKGVAGEIIAEVTRGIDDEENAYTLGRRRMSSLARQDYPDFQRRLSNYLGYRGFSYEVIRKTVVRLWEEKEQTNDRAGL